MSITPAKLKAMQNRISPGLFLNKFAERLAEDGSDLLDSLFAIALGNTTKRVDGTVVQHSDPKDVLAAMKLIMEMGGMKEAVKHLLKVSQKGRPQADAEDEAWVEEYADIADGAKPARKAPPRKRG